MAKAALRLNGRLLNLRPLSDAVAKVERYLERLPKGELRTTNDLLTALKVSVPTTTRAARELPDNRQRVYNPTNNQLWGSRASIAHLRAELKQLEGR